MKSSSRIQPNAYFVLCKEDLMPHGKLFKGTLDILNVVYSTYTSIKN